MNSIETGLNYILAGGKGVRLNPLTKTLLKPLLPVGENRRCIDFSLIQSKESGIQTIVAGYYRFDQLEEYLKSVGYTGILVKDSQLVGDGSLAEHLDVLKDFGPQYLILSPADHVHNIDYAKLIDVHRQKMVKATLVVINPTTDKNHRVYIDSDGKVIAYQTPPDNYASLLHAIGVYCLDFNELSDRILAIPYDQRSKVDIRGIFIDLIKDGLAYTYLHPGYWRDIGTFDRLFEENVRTVKEDGNVIVGKNTISASAILKSCLVLGGVTIESEVNLSEAIVDHGSHLKKDKEEPVEVTVFTTEKGRRVFSPKNKISVV